jgi:hypothetical protein
MNRYLRHLVERGTGIGPEPIRPRLPTMFEPIDAEPLPVIEEKMIRSEDPPSPRQPVRERPPEAVRPPADVLPPRAAPPRRDEPPVRARIVEPPLPAADPPLSPTGPADIRQEPARPESPPVPVIGRPQRSTVDGPAPPARDRRPDSAATPPPVPAVAPAVPTAVHVVADPLPQRAPSEPDRRGRTVAGGERSVRTQLSRSSAPEPRIQVRIGRVEVRAVFAPPEAAAASLPPDRAPLLSLDEYLKQRDGAS